MSIHSPAVGDSPRHDKRERILCAAERVFAERGFYNSRVADVAREAGVADGTIYLYFKSKDELLYSVFESRMERVNGSLAEAMRDGDAPAQKVRSFIRTHLRLVAEQPLVAEVLTVELRQSSKFMKEYSHPRFADFLKLLAAVIAEGQSSGEFNSEPPPPLAARAVFGMLDEIALSWLLGKQNNFDIVRAAEWLGDFIVAGLQRRKVS